jgi:hypothetical protein
MRELGLSRFAFYPLVLFVFFSYFVLALAFRREKASREQRALALYLLLSTLWCGALLGRYHGHLFLGMGGVIAVVLALSRDQGLLKRPSWEPAAAALFVALGLVQIWAGGVGRSMVKPHQPTFAQSDLYPLRIQASPVTASNAEVVDYLKDKPGDLAVFHGYAFLVPVALRRPSYNPTLFYAAALTVPSKPEGWKRWQQELISAMEKRRPKFVVVGLGWLRWKDALGDSVSYFQEKYESVFSGQRLRVLQRKAP